MDGLIARAASRLVVVALAVLAAALATAPRAEAHAELLTSEPAKDEVVAQNPAQVRLRFTEPVETAFGAVQVLDADAHRVDDGELERTGRDVTVGIDQPLARGTYLVSYRVVSADGHPVGGAVTFHLGAPGAVPAVVATDVLGDSAPRHVAVLFAIVRGLDFALILLVAGGGVLLALAFRDLAPQLRATLALALAAAAGVLVLVSVAGIVLQGATAGGSGLVDALRMDVVRTVLGTRFGTVWAMQASLAATCALVFLLERARSRDAAWTAAAAAAVLVVAPSASGHASVAGAAAFVADVAHVAAAAAWAGGLTVMVLALALASSERWPLAARLVPRFSAVAVGAVAVLLIAGVTNAYLEIRTLRALWTTTYGQLLLAKLALVLPLLALGLYNNRFAAPRLRAGIASAAERVRFLRAAGVELVLLAVIVGVTAVLVAEPPARAQVTPSGPVAETAELGNLRLRVVVNPAAAGANIIHLYLTDATGRPVDVTEARVKASLADASIGPLRYPAHRLARGHYAVHGAQLTLSGDWRLRVEARRGEFELLVTTISVPIRKEA